MDATERERYTCVACDELIDALTPDGRCAACGVSYASAEAKGVSDADVALAALRGQAAQIAARIEQWEAYREGMIVRLRLTAPEDWAAQRAAASAVPAADATASDAVAAPPEQTPLAPASVPADPFAAPDGPGLAADPAPAAATVAAVAAPAAASAPVPSSVFAQPRAPREPGRAAEVARRALTAPALLGIAGASLLIAASVVFVALTWTVVSPLVRGLIVSGVALLVSGIAVWLRRMELTISSGAVGIVAMGFAATASLAFSRGSDVMGAYETPAALLVACAAGLVLSRLAIAWTGSASGLAFAGAAVTFAIATTSAVSAADGPGDPGVVRGIWVWSVVGTLAAVALAATHRLWRFTVAKVAVRWASVAWLSIVGAGTAAWMWVNVGYAVPLDAAFALLSVVALGVLARWWTTLATGPAVLLVTLIAPAGASAWGATAWQQATTVAVVVAIALAVGPRFPVASRLPMFIALSPGYLTVAVAAATYSIVITVARILAGTYTPDTELWAGAAALIAGLSIAQLRLWRLDSALVRSAQVVGAAMVVTGSGIVAFGAAESVGRDYHTSVGLAMAVAAALLLTAVRAWTDARARWLSANSAVAFALVSAFHGAWGVVISEVALAGGLAVLAAAFAVLAWRAAQSPWWGGFPATVVVLGVVSSLVARCESDAVWVLGAAVLAATLVVWLGRGIPRRFHVPVLTGLVPVLGVVAFGAGASLLDVVDRTIADGRGVTQSGWLAVLVAGAAGLAGVRRWPVATRLAPVTALSGAVVSIVTAAGVTITAAHAWLPDATAAAALLAAPAALALAATGWAWRSRPAAWTSGVSAAVILTVAGLNAALALAQEPRMPWLAFAAALVAVALLATFSAWWPRVTLAPASLVLTAGALGLGSRAQNVDVAFGSMALAAALAIVAARRLRREHARVAALGTVPALAAGAVYVLVHAVDAVLQVARLSWAAAPQASWWLPVAAVILITGHLGALSATVTGMRARGLRVAATVTALIGAAVLTQAAGRVAAGVAWGDATAGPSTADLVHDASVAAVSAAAILGTAGVVLWARWAHRRGWLPLAAVRVADVGALAWLTASAITISVSLVPAGRSWAVGGLCVAVIGLVAALVLRWPARLTAGPVAFLASLLPFTLLVERVSAQAAVCAAAAVASASVWLVRGLKRSMVPHVLVGQSLAHAAVVFVALQSAMVTIARVTGPGGDVDPREFGLEPAWSVPALAVAGVALLAWGRARRWAGDVVLVIALVSVYPLTPFAAAALLAALGLAAAVLGRRARLHDELAIFTGLVAVLWGSQSRLVMAGALAAVSIGAVAVARRQRESGPRWAVLIAPFAAGGAAALAALHVGAAAIVAAPLALTVVAAVAVTLEKTGIDPDGRRVPWIVGVATVLVPLSSLDLGAAGLSLIVAAVAWFVLIAAGRAYGRWWSTVTVSLGVILLMADRGVGVVEAYTIVPALAALVLGIQWMRHRPEVRSITALWPALVIGLVPSCIALARNPDGLPRTIALTASILVFALLGARLRWFAFVLATATTALVVSALQIIVGSNMVLRLISFAVVGSLLLAIASWFERIKTLR